MKRDALTSRYVGPAVLSGAIASFAWGGVMLAPKPVHAESAAYVVHAVGSMSPSGVSFEVAAIERLDAGTGISDGGIGPLH